VRVAAGLAAAPILEQGQVDLIVLDIGLPDINGFDLLKDIRRTRTTPIILLTAHTAEIDRVLGLEIGADDYVAKPFSPRELAARVKAVLRRTHPATGGWRRKAHSRSTPRSGRSRFSAQRWIFRNTNTRSSDTSSSANWMLSLMAVFILDNQDSGLHAQQNVSDWVTGG
jgi:DNA-binding response OmpR family regulator